MGNLHTEDTFMWENVLIDDYDKDYAPGRRICIDDATPADWDALADKRLRARGVDTPQERSLKEMVENAEGLGLYDDPSKPLSQQIGGEHYRQGSIQPIEYIHANEMDFFSGNVVKYITRWKYKNGLEDLKKAKHYIELLMEQEYGYNG